MSRNPSVGMYSTKSMIAKKADSYITIGDPYDKKRVARDSRRQGKQFINNPPKKGQHFSSYNYMPTKYQQSNPYFRKQPPESRKLGFGSHDASKRDEFSNQIAMEQYRETLRHENQSTKKGKKAAAEAAAKAAAASGTAVEDPIEKMQAELAALQGEQKQPAEKTLYDRIFTIEHDTMVGKSHSRHQSINRGPLKTTNSMFGDGCDASTTAKSGKSSSQYGRMNVTKDFYNRSHLHTDMD